MLEEGIKAKQEGEWFAGVIETIALQLLQLLGTLHSINNIGICLIC